MGLLSFRVCSLETFQYNGNICGIFSYSTTYNGQLLFVINGRTAKWNLFEMFSN